MTGIIGKPADAAPIMAAGPTRATVEGILAGLGDRELVVLVVALVSYRLRRPAAGAVGSGPGGGTDPQIIGYNRVLELS